MTMDEKREPVSMRYTRLFQSVLTRHCPMQKRSAHINISYDALIDSFLAVFDECSKEGIKKDIYVSYFLNKYKSLVTEIRSLRVSLNDFELKSVIGRGYFGEVRVAKEKGTGDIFAIKIINKMKTLQNAGAALFEEERDILSTTSSPWLTNLQYAFQDPQNLYLVMEYLPGGDLMSLLYREGGRLSVDQARFYLAETLLAVHELHRLGYAHRDVKPDNVLLDRLGHVKLADFGSAARLNADGRVLTAMPAGTPDYIAPEVLQAFVTEKGKKIPYGIECDFWSLGVLAYALVFGASPFSGPRTSITYSKILKHETAVPYPDSVSVTDSLKDLINSLLKPAAIRLDYHAVRKHLFFLEVDFSSLRQVVPPFVPVVNSPEDTANFNCTGKTSEATLMPKESQKEFSGKQLPFIGFTYSGLPDESEPSNKGEVGKQPIERREQNNLETVRRENQELLKKLLSAQQTNKSHDTSVERIERELTTLQRELHKQKQMNASLSKHIEEERLDRRQTEEKALMIVRQGKQAQEREMKSVLAEWQAKVDELMDNLTCAHTKNNELTSRCDRADNEIRALLVEIDKYKETESTYKEKLSKAREFKRRSVTEFESRLDRIQHQEEKWQIKLNAEVTAKQAVLEELQELRIESSKSEELWRHERQKLEQDLRELKTKLQTAETQVSAAHLQLADTSKVDVISSRLLDEQAENAKLRIKLNALETELSNTTHSFLEHETAGQREQLKELEIELRAVTEEKSQLQKKIQAMQERDKENKSKLNDVERILEGLEYEVKKLERENATLKQAVSDPTAPKLSSDVEIQYQQKVILLQQQIDKLEGQVERLRESAILEKQELGEVKKKLSVTEKELSNTKIDVRIANREAKTAEDQVKKLETELRGVRERLRVMQEEREAERGEEKDKAEALRSELKLKEEEIGELRKARAEAASLGDALKLLQGEYNSLRQQFLTSERQLSAAKAQVEALQLSVQTLTNEKTALSGTVEELRSRVSNLELNNTVLRETGKMLDEQLEDYEKFVSDQAETIQNLKLENGNLHQTISTLEMDLTAVRTSLTNEKSLKNKAENLICTLQDDLGARAEVIQELRDQLDFANGSGDALAARVMDKEKLIRDLELELNERCEDIKQLQAEVLWLKEETSAKLTDVYLFKEENCRLNQELEETGRFADALQERIRELERVITELETFHRQREMKDEATKQQQNKLISFLQTKLQEDKKKKTLADKLFGGRRRDPPSPQTPQLTSPRHSPRVPVKSTSDTLRKKAVNSGKKATTSPRTQQALSQLVNSPSSRMQRQGSLPRMHHKIPHRFKLQSSSSGGKCASCHSAIGRGSKVSVCVHCQATAHPNCAVTAPKTCGLPAGYVQHFAQSVDKPVERAEEMLPNDTNQKQGWVDLMMPGESTWHRRYLKLQDNEVVIFDTEPERANGPAQRWSLLKPGGTTLVSDEVSPQELPWVAKQDLSFVFKVVSIPHTTCWPTETYYLLVHNSPDKTKWITALQSAIHTSVQSAINNITLVCRDNKDLHINCLQQLTHEVTLLGTECGLFSLNKWQVEAELVQIYGVTIVHNICAAQHINLVLMVTGENRRLVSADYRLLVSNANAAACANPGVETEIVALDDEEPVMLVSISEELDGAVYLAAATTKHFCLLKWCPLSSKFKQLYTMSSPQPVTCVLYHNDSIIVGGETFQYINLKDFSIKEVLSRPHMSHSLVRLHSFPIKAFNVGRMDILLCFRELGLFVDHSGQKTRSDLKWSQVPRDFAFCAPFLYVVAASSVEIIRLSPVSEGLPATDDDALSIATTATLADTHTVPVDNPCILGVKDKCGVFVRSGLQVLLIEGERLCPDVMESATILNRVASEGQFSFTSSIVGSLDGNDSDECKSSPETRIQHTEL